MSVNATITGVSVKLGSVQALDRVSLTVEAGKFLALLGPSGSGKTTMLNVIGGFVQPDEGGVELDGRDMTGVPPHRRDIGMVFQSYALFPHMSVADNIGFPLRMRGVPRSERGPKIQEALALVGLAEHGPRSVLTLSGGQRQRVALARAVVFEPGMLLLDEPLAALDKQLRDSMQFELKALQNRVGITAVAVTHDQVEALTMADTVAVMNDGHVEQVGTPKDLYLRPETLFVATFLGEANLLPAIRGETVGFGRLGGDTVSGTAVIRPERLTLAQPPHVAGTGLEAEASVDEVTFQGARVRVRVRLKAQPDLVLVVAAPPLAAAQSLKPGDDVVIHADPEAMHVIPDVDAPAGVVTQGEHGELAPGAAVTSGPVQ
ncbi:MAG TPA: ABC transporter ATP-binding protein [Thermoleophilaceae bacterium]|nr:ABC transporter ATP-binding protein [Thermoleophilaceae bacterium]